MGPSKTNFYTSTDKFISAIREVNPKFNPAKEDEWGNANYETKQVFIDLTKKREQDPEHAGFLLMAMLWHEWEHLDIQERTSGELLNDPKIGIRLPDNNSIEPFRAYIGGRIRVDDYSSDIYAAYERFDEVWVESILARRIYEVFNLRGDEPIILAGGEYYNNGWIFSQGSLLH